MSLVKKVLGLVGVGALALTMSSCGQSQVSSTSPLRDEGVYITVDSAYNRGNCSDSGDWDFDGDLDIVSSDGYSGDVYLYRNNDGIFSKSSEPIFQIPSGYNRGCSLDIVDIDKDGDWDVLASDGFGNIHLYRNISE